MTDISHVAFSAYLGSPDTNISGEGAFWTLGSGTALTETFDLSNNFAVSTFTAPINGYYFFQALITVTNLTSLMTSGNIRLVVNGISYDGGLANPYASCRVVDNAYSFAINKICYMALGQTAYVQVSVAGGAGNTCGAYVGNQLCVFSGYIVY